MTFAKEFSVRKNADDTCVVLQGLGWNHAHVVECQYGEHGRTYYLIKCDGKWFHTDGTMQ